MLKWSVELGEFDIQYVPRTAIKAQVVADFILELTTLKGGTCRHTEQWWGLHMDGSANAKKGRADLILEGPDGQLFIHAIHFGFKATNNEADTKHSCPDLS